MKTEQTLNLLAIYSTSTALSRQLAVKHSTSTITYTDVTINIIILSLLQLRFCLLGPHLSCEKKPFKMFINKWMHRRVSKTNWIPQL